MSSPDVAAFDEIYERLRDAVYAYFVGRASESEAPDLLQETFVRVWRNLATVRDFPPARQRAWIFTVARNLAVDTYRSNATKRDAAQLLATAPAVSHGPEDAALSAERMATLDHAIRQLPEPQRVVITMHAMSDLTSAEIGAALGIPAGTVRCRLSLARQQLAAALRDSDTTPKGNSHVPTR